MARHRIAVPTAGIDSAADLIEEYLAAITCRLPGPRRAAEGAVRELRDGLHDAVGAHRRAGLGVPAAARAAIAESGPPDVVAAAYRPVLVNRHARRTCRTLLATGPAIGLLWLLALTPGKGPTVLLHTIPALAAVLAVGVLTGLAALATTGRAGRLLPNLPNLPRHAAALTCAAAIAVDAAVLTLATTRLVSIGVVPQWPIALAAVGSLTRLAYTQHAARTGLSAAH